MIDSGNLRLALLSAAVLGFRHGLDYDHIAAISDISSVQSRAKDALRYGLLYVSGHATTVAILGAAAVAFRISLPASTDRWAERLVGITLLVLGVYVLSTMFRTSSGNPSGDPSRNPSGNPSAHAGHNHARPRTRITLLINGLLWIYWKLTRVFGGTRGEAPQVFKDGYGTGSTFLVGVIHGLGAETPTQLLLFLLAANLGGTWAGLLGLLMFIVGLVVMNTLMCAVAAGLFSVDKLRAWIPLDEGLGGVRSRALTSLLNGISTYGLRSLTALTSAYSIVVGTIFLLGAADKLPSLTG